MNEPQLIRPFPVDGRVGSFRVFNTTNNAAMSVPGVALCARGWELLRRPQQQALGCWVEVFVRPRIGRLLPVCALAYGTIYPA